MPVDAPKGGASELELRQASLDIRARRLSLTLATLLIVAGISVALIGVLTETTAFAPFGLIGGGIALVRFGGRRPDR